jgi:hypothetical protein
MHIIVVLLTHITREKNAYNSIMLSRPTGLYGGKSASGLRRNVVGIGHTDGRERGALHGWMAKRPIMCRAFGAGLT